MEPTGRMVINIDIYINIDIDTRTINPGIKGRVKTKNAARLPGNAILYNGFGIKYSYEQAAKHGA